MTLVINQLNKTLYITNLFIDFEIKITEQAEFETP